MIGEREEQTAPFSHLSPDPLPPILSHPSASIIPPPPGVGRAGGETSSPRSSPIRCLDGFLSLTPRLIRSRSPHLLIPGVIFPHAPFSVAHPFMPPSSPPTQDDRAKRPPPPLIMASIKRPAHSTSRTRRRTERGEWRAVHDRCLDRRCSRCPPPSRRISPRKVLSRGEAVILVAYIPRRFSQLIVSSVPRLAVPSGREDKQTAGGKASR